MTRRAVVVGGGTMGRGIAVACSRAGYAVDIVEIDEETANEVAEATASLLAEGVRLGKLGQAQADDANARIATCAKLEQLASGPDVAIEAVPESVDLKGDILVRLESLEPRILATNTSAISIDLLASDLRRPDRFLGLHFFNPVHAMELVEVVVGASTTEATKRLATRLCAELGKGPVVVEDRPGFATSRLGVALGLEAIRMVDEDVASPADIDRAMELGYRHPVGPLRLTDLVGLDVRLAIARGLTEAYGDRFQPPELLERLVAQGRLGKKVGRGFYEW